MILLLYWLLTITLPLLAAQETDSVTEFQLLNFTTSSSSVTEIESTTMKIISEEKSSLTCFTQSQLELLEDAVVRVSVNELEKGSVEELWSFWEKLKIGGGQLMERIIKLSLRKHVTVERDYFTNTTSLQLNNCFGERFLQLLRFVNQSSISNWKLVGYQALFSEISSNTSSSVILAHFLNLQHYLSLNTNSDLNALLNNLESLINGIIQSSTYQFSYPNSNCGRPFIHLEYLIKIVCATYPNKIKELWDQLSEQYSLELLVRFISELEKNNQMSYALLAASKIKDELKDTVPTSGWSGYFGYVATQNKNLCSLRRQLYLILQTLPKSALVRKLLSQNRFYIKNAYDQKYLHMTEKSSSSSNSYYSTPEYARVSTSSDRNVIWTIEFQSYPKNAVELYDKDRRNIGTQRCDIHDELFVRGPKSRSYDDLYRTWTLEIGDNDKLFIRIGVVESFNRDASGEYLCVGKKDKVTISSLNENKLSKCEWILESVDTDDSFDKEFECKDSSEMSLGAEAGFSSGTSSYSIGSTSYIVGRDSPRRFITIGGDTSSSSSGSNVS